MQKPKCVKKVGLGIERPKVGLGLERPYSFKMTHLSPLTTDHWPTEQSQLWLPGLTLNSQILQLTCVSGSRMALMSELFAQREERDPCSKTVA